MTCRREMLAECGRAIYGDDWQRPIARALGPLHPQGPREAIDDRLVRRWAAGDRPVPDWVGSALRQLLTESAARCEAEATQMRALADLLREAAAP